jgi:hypothetical protein
MRASKVIYNILMTPLAILFVLLVGIIGTVSTVLRMIFSVPYGMFKGLSEACHFLMREFADAYNVGKTKVVGSVQR